MKNKLQKKFIKEYEELCEKYGMEFSVDRDDHEYRIDVEIVDNKTYEKLGEYDL